MTTKAKFLPAISREEFDALTPPEQRVAIARDVLAQLDARRIKPTIGVWVDADEEYGVQVEYSRDSLIADGAPPCEACAIGACFISAVRLGNEFSSTTDYGLGELSMEAVVGRFFPDAQYAALEYVFERGMGATDREGMEGSDWTDEQIEAFQTMAYSVDSPDARLRLICNNIIANDGDFRPDAGGAQ